VAYVGLLSALRGPINIGGTSIGFIVQGLSAAGRVHEVVADRTGDDEREGGHSSSIAGDMTFDGVTFGYGDMTVFDDASFEIEAGQFVAIVGATGSGKTTLVQLLNGTYFADNGRVLVDGCSVEEWDLESLRSQIAVIEQDVTLFSRSIRDNVTFGLADGVDDGTVRWALELAQADEFVDRMTEGMNTVVGERGVTLSGGQRQRIGIARALLVDPRILVLDDATSALDAATERRMRDAIFGAAKGRTTLLISNRLACIREADRILVLDKGRVAGFGTHRELMATVPLYARMYEPYQVADVAVSAAGGGR
jgi:ATP-binding cassette subfamily B protein